MSIYLIIIIFCANRFNICFQARSERDLPYCKSSSVCSVLHRRFWGASPLLERFCRCPGRLECPYLWSQDTLKDNQSMQLNNRSQLKVNIIRKLVTLLTQNLNCNGLMWQKNYPFHPLTCKNDNQGMKFENAQDCFGWQFCCWRKSAFQKLLRSHSRAKNFVLAWQQNQYCLLVGINLNTHHEIRIEFEWSCYKIRGLPVKSNFASQLYDGHEAEGIRFKRWRSAPLWKNEHFIKRNSRRKSQCTKNKNWAKTLTWSAELLSYNFFIKFLGRRLPRMCVCASATPRTGAGISELNRVA